MATTKLYTPSDLCARLGVITHCEGCGCVGRHLYSEGGKLFIQRDCGNGCCILSLNDKLPSDECEYCGEKANDHSSSKNGICIDYDANSPVILKNTRFKPIILTVKSIRLVERCECGHDKTDHGFVGIINEKRIDDCQIGMCQCMQFKPVQMVEITTEG